jgi:hypothetical protein
VKRGRVAISILLMTTQTKTTSSAGHSHTDLPHRLAVWQEIKGWLQGGSASGAGLGRDFASEVLAVVQQIQALATPEEGAGVREAEENKKGRLP